MINRPMTLEEVESCDSAYLLYDKDDPNVHVFKRLRTCDSFISFDREHETCKYARVQPHLWKDVYGTVWLAFRDPPDKDDVRRWRRQIVKRIIKEKQ